MPQKRGDFRRNHLLSAQDETRTHTILRPLPPQSSVYTNFTTCARVRQIVLSDVAARHKAHDCLRFWHPTRKPCFLWGPRSSKNNFSSFFSSITKNTFRELKSFFECYKDHFAVPRTGLEPARLATYAPETYASTNSATWARRNSLATRFVVCTTKMSPRLLLFKKPLFAQ